MSEKGGDFSEIMQCLCDAGCCEDTSCRFLEYESDSRTDDQIRLLARQRREIMERLHSDQKKVDCIDYLILKLRQRSAIGGEK